MKLNVTDFEIIFNEELFTETNLSKEDVWFDIKIILNKSSSFEVINLSSEELFNFLCKIDDILEDKDALIYFDDCEDIYLESTKDCLKFQSKFETTNGLVIISTLFENNEIVKDGFNKFVSKIKNTISTWETVVGGKDVVRGEALSEDELNIIVNNISSELEKILSGENIKKDIDNIKDFVDKNPGLMKNNEIKVSDEISSELKILLQNYNIKMFSNPDFINIIKNIERINNKEDKQKILNNVVSQVKNIMNV